MHPYKKHTTQNKETRQLAPFKELHAGGSWDVIMEQGDNEGVGLEGKNIDLNKVITEVKNNSLHIYLVQEIYLWLVVVLKN